MRALHQRVNIVPVLAKADTLTPAEVERMKNKVRGGWHSLKPSQWVPGDGGALGLGSLLGWGLSPTPAWTLPWSILRAHSTVEDHVAHVATKDMSPWCSARGWKGAGGGS